MATPTNYRTIASLPPQAQAAARQVQAFLADLDRIYEREPGNAELLQRDIAAGNYATAMQRMAGWGYSSARGAIQGVGNVTSSAMDASGVNALARDAVSGTSIGTIGSVMNGSWSVGTFMPRVFGNLAADMRNLLTPEAGKRVRLSASEIETISAVYAGSLYTHTAHYQPKGFFEGLFSADFTRYLKAGISFVMENYLPEGFGGSRTPRSFDAILRDDQREEALTNVRADLEASGVRREIADALTRRDAASRNRQGDVTQGLPGGQRSPAQVERTPGFMEHTLGTLKDTGVAVGGTAAAVAGYGADRATDTARELAQGNLGSAAFNAAATVATAKAAQVVGAGTVALGTGATSMGLRAADRTIEGLGNRAHERTLSRAERYNVRQAEAAARTAATAEGLTGADAARRVTEAREAAQDAARAQAALAREARAAEAPGLVRRGIDVAERGLSRVTSIAWNVATFSWVRPTLDVVIVKPVSALSRTVSEWRGAAAAAHVADAAKAAAPAADDIVRAAGATARGPRIATPAAVGLGAVVAGGATLAMGGSARAALGNAAEALPGVGTGIAASQGRTAEAWIRGITDAGTAATVVTAPAAATGAGAAVPVTIGVGTLAFNEVTRPIARVFGADVDPSVLELAVRALNAPLPRAERSPELQQFDRTYDALGKLAASQHVPHEIRELATLRMRRETLEEQAYGAASTTPRTSASGMPDWSARDNARRELQRVEAQFEERYAAVQGNPQLAGALNGLAGEQPVQAAVPAGTPRLSDSVTGGVSVDGTQRPNAPMTANSVGLGAVMVQ